MTAAPCGVGSKAAAFTGGQGGMTANLKF